MEKEKKVIWIIISLIFLIFISVGFIFYDSESKENTFENSDSVKNLNKPPTSQQNNETTHPIKKGPFVSFPPLEVVCENERGYKVVKDIFGRNALSVESKLRLRESGFDFSEIKGLDCLKYLNLEWHYIEDISYLEELENLEVLSLAWTNVPEEDCRQLNIKLLNTEVFCYHDTPEF